MPHYMLERYPKRFGRMLRQVALQVNFENELQDAARDHGVRMNVVDCKPFNKTGMSILLELRGDSPNVNETFAAIKRVKGVRSVLRGEDGGDVVPVLLVLDRPGICRTSNDAAIVCLECPLNAQARPALWRFIVRSNSDFRQVLSKLEREGIEAKLKEVSPLDQRETLTERQKEIVVTAVARGYFEFPRKVSLTELSRLVGVRPSTLSEILRSAERRIMLNAVAGISRES